MLLGEASEFRFQDWNLYYQWVVLRLSLYAYLGVSTISLKKLFNGAKMNIPVDVEIKVPPSAVLKVSKIGFRYPSFRAPHFKIGNYVVNADGAPFDAFLYLETTASHYCLLFK